MSGKETDNKEASGILAMKASELKAAPSSVEESKNVSKDVKLEEVGGRKVEKERPGAGLVDDADTGAAAGADTVADEDEEEGVTMVDVLQDEQDLEEDAKAVLGAADDKNCTYLQGYMGRQALYACLTCCGPAKAPGFKAAGVCLACSYHCHEGHDIVELYTKRNFRCDCGNSRFDGANGKQKCRLADIKEQENVENMYNQNFSGVYCTCHRPYPDPEDPISDSMIQCIMCEDWFHGRHLTKPSGAPHLPADDSYSEMICQLCHGQFHDKFLHAYTGYSVSKVAAKAADAAAAQDEKEEVKVDGDECDDKAAQAKPAAAAADEKSLEKEPEEKASAAAASTSTSATKGEPSKKLAACCTLKPRSSSKSPMKIGGEYALFMVADWRRQLCQCQDCLKMYSELKVTFLIAEEDTVHHYEEKSKADGGSQYEEGMKALSEMDRVKHVEAIQGYNSMKSNLMDYLRTFAETGKTVSKEDIQQFFEQMNGAKRQRVEIPKFCK